LTLFLLTIFQFLLHIFAQNVARSKNAASRKQLYLQISLPINFKMADDAAILTFC